MHHFYSEVNQGVSDLSPVQRLSSIPFQRVLYQRFECDYVILYTFVNLCVCENQVGHRKPFHRLNQH